MALPRVHAFELNDQPWLPEALRRAETDYLGFVVAKAGRAVTFLVGQPRG